MLTARHKKVINNFLEPVFAEIGKLSDLDARSTLSKILSPSLEITRIKKNAKINPIISNLKRLLNLLETKDIDPKNDFYEAKEVNSLLSLINPNDLVNPISAKMIKKYIRRQIKLKNSNYNLLIACQNNDYKEVEAWLGRGANVNAKGVHGNASVHIAARSGNSTLMKILHSHGADLAAINNDLLTAIHIASKYNKNYLVDYLFKKMDAAVLKNLNNQKKSPLQFAIENLCASTIDEFVKKQIKVVGHPYKIGDNEGRIIYTYALIQAVSRGDFLAAYHFLSMKADIEIQFKDYPAKSESVAKFLNLLDLTLFSPTILRRENVDFLKYLLINMTNINFKYEDGSNLLMNFLRSTAHAQWSSIHCEIGKILLDYYDIKHSNIHGDTALDLFVFQYDHLQHNVQERVISARNNTLFALLDSGATTNKPDALLEILWRRANINKEFYSKVENYLKCFMKENDTTPALEVPKLSIEDNKFHYYQGNNSLFYKFTQKVRLGDATKKNKIISHMKIIKFKNGEYQFVSYCDKKIYIFNQSGKCISQFNTGIIAGKKALTILENDCIALLYTKVENFPSDDLKAEPKVLLGGIKIWKIYQREEVGTPLYFLPQPKNIYPINFYIDIEKPCSKLLFAELSTKHLIGAANNTVYVWDKTDGSCINKITLGNDVKDSISAFVALSDGSGQIIVGQKSGALSQFNPITGKFAYNFNSNVETEIIGIKHFHTDIFVILTNNNMINLWNSKTKEVTETINLQEYSPATCIDISSHGNLVVGFQNGVCRVWDINEEIKIVDRINLRKKESIHSLFALPNEKILGGSTILQQFSVSPNKRM